MLLVYTGLVTKALRDRRYYGIHGIIYSLGHVYIYTDNIIVMYFVFVIIICIAFVLLHNMSLDCERPVRAAMYACAALTSITLIGIACAYMVIVSGEVSYRELYLFK